MNGRLKVIKGGDGNGFRLDEGGVGVGFNGEGKGNLKPSPGQCLGRRLPRPNWLRSVRSRFLNGGVRRIPGKYRLEGGIKRQFVFAGGVRALKSKCDGDADRGGSGVRGHATSAVEGDGACLRFPNASSGIGIGVTNGFFLIKIGRAHV